MMAIQPAAGFTPNPRRSKSGCRTISMRTMHLRTMSYTMERLIARAGDGSAARLGRAVMEAERLLEEAIHHEESVINAVAANRDQAPHEDEHYPASPPSRLDARLDVSA